MGMHRLKFMNIDIASLKTEFENELFNSVIPFWKKYSLDKNNGGYYNCLSRDGSVYDTTKYMWLHGRQIWMFSKLYNTFSHDRNWLDIARHGMDFMKKYAVTENGRVYFSLNEKGRPVYMQRKLFTECFYAMALAEYGRATGSGEMLDEAKLMFQRIWEWSGDASLLGRAKFSGEAGFQSLAVPMILLNVAEEVFGQDFSLIYDKVRYCIDSVKDHFVNGLVYENIVAGGEQLNLSDARLLNPGHAIEAGWFLKHWADMLGDQDLDILAGRMIRQSFDAGWDNEHGGIFYFLDAGGFSPTRLEWDRKLWWPHCEAMYAFLLLYSETGRPDDLNRFQLVRDYAFSHFSDNQNGEWYGYLNREGEVSMDFKGGPYKGCFHVPRTLYLCLKILDNLTI